MVLRSALLLVTAVLWASAPRAQAPPDSLREAPLREEPLREYELGEVVVGERAEVRETASTLQRIGLAELDRLDAASVAEAVRLIPGAHLQTNSRGEALVYLRAAGERQVALFFDGALLNVPWDNRVDLALVPSPVVGNVTVAKGVPSVLWGANVLGGAVNMVSRGLSGEGTYAEAVAQGGWPAFGQGAVTALGRRGGLSWVGSAGYAARDGLALPDGAELPFSQPDDDLRTNTDVRLANGFARVAYRFAPRTRLGVSVLHLDGEKGVAPEGHLDPAVERVRFWRYPRWRTSLVVANGEAGLGAGTDLRGAVWASRFAQTIDAFAGVGYDVLDERQEDEDLTLGGRAVLQRRLAPAAMPATLRLALSGVVSRHRQQETAFAAGTAETDPSLTYRQGLYSAGLEAETLPLRPLRLTLGAGLDVLATPETGDKPARDPSVDWSASAGAVYAPAPRWALTAAVGRKTRFPTLRELFGEALQRFALNPDLRPESALAAEAGVTHERPRLRAEATLFLTRTDDTIDQVRLPDGRRQRVNLGSSRVYGVEAVATAQLLDRLRLDGHLTLMRARGFTEDGAERYLAEKPEALGRLALTYSPALGPTASVEAVYTGVAFSPDGDGFARLAPSLVFHVRAGYRLLIAGAAAEVFARVDNVTDAVVLPQLGLPGPGREVQAGLKLAL